ncbi:efflux RND transporter periplasmic adaptor subunit [Nitrospirota bacterium]
MPINKKKYFIAILVMLCTIVISYGLNTYKPQARKARPRATMPVVSTIELHPSTENIRIESYGNIIPAKKIDVFAEVEGKALEVHQDLVPGGIIKKGERIVQIDPKDYELDIRAKRAFISEAKLELSLEQAQQNIARELWDSTGVDGGKARTNMSLALREPQIENVLAKLDAAESALNAAELARDRTVVRSPFNAMVIEKSIDPGQLVTRQRPVATIVGTDEFWAEISISVDKLKFIRFPLKNKKKGSKAQVIIDMGSGQSIIREAKVYKLLGELDPKGKMAKILLKLPDPLRLTESNKNSGRALIGSFVTVQIDAGSIDNVYSIPREAMRDNNRVWILSDDNTLEVRNVKIVWQRKDDVLVSDGVSFGDRLITSRLQSPLPGMKLLPDNQKKQQSQAPGN